MPTTSVDQIDQYSPYCGEINRFDRTPVDKYMIGKVTPSKHGWQVQSTKSWSFYVPMLRAHQTPPRVGDSIDVYGGIGYEIQGFELHVFDSDASQWRSEVVFYRTPDQREVKRERWLAEHEREKRERFEAERAKLDADFEALPEIFRARIQRFRDADPEFRVDAEAYEMFILTEAVKLAEGLGSVERVEQYRDASYDEQKVMAPFVDDGHSGNTHSRMIYFARVLLDPDGGWPC